VQVLELELHVAQAPVQESQNDVFQKVPAEQLMQVKEPVRLKLAMQVKQ
jgi:hypothetical protein